uniref:Uncharacterized protein n=1 Tax=Avena sativa TaxID=4498 RepID=A0ACD5VDJ5_AVESA
MPEAEESWKRAAAVRLATALGDCVRAWHRLGDALRDLQDRDGEGRYILLDSGADNVEQASWLLSASMAGTVAIEYLALRGCAPVPTDPVAAPGDLHGGADAHYDVWLALARLQTAREYGQDALRATEAAFGHLSAAQAMAAHLPAPAGLDAVMEEQVDAATNQIREVLGAMVNMSGMVSCAAEPPARIQSA